MPTASSRPSAVRSRPSVLRPSRARPVLALAAAAVVAGCTAGSDPSGTTAAIGPPVEASATAEGITVTGSGVAAGQPDVVTVTVGVDVREADVQDALDTANAATREVIDTLDGQGIAEEDRQTRDFAVHPVNDQADPGDSADPEGYAVRNLVEATVRDVDTLGEVIQAATEAASDHARVHGVHFDLEDDGDQVVAARQAALEDARDKAVQYAEMAGVELGELIAVEDRSRTSPQRVDTAQMDAAGDEAAAAVPTEPGEQDVTVEVVTRWSLAD